jgi:hypothetical protein
MRGTSQGSCNLSSWRRQSKTRPTCREGVIRQVHSGTVGRTTTAVPTRTIGAYAESCSIFLNEQGSTVGGVAARRHVPCLSTSMARTVPLG